MGEGGPIERPEHQARVTIGVAIFCRDLSDWWDSPTEERPGNKYHDNSVCVIQFILYVSYCIIVCGIVRWAALPFFSSQSISSFSKERHTFYVKIYRSTRHHPRPRQLLCALPPVNVGDAKLSAPCGCYLSDTAACFRTMVMAMNAPYTPEKKGM